VWASKGFLHPTPGAVVDYDFIAETIRQCCKRFAVKSLGFFPWNATQLASGLYGEGVPMIEVRQGYRTLSEPAKKLESLVVSRKIRHPNNALANWCVGHATIDTDAAGNIKLSKGSSTERIDAAAALVTALATWLHQKQDATGPSVYEQPERTITWL
jgi:phage terminase large subunit-like protein